MLLLLERDIFDKRFTGGKLSIDGSFFCYTLEDMVRDRGVKVYGETAIPAGVYDLKMTYSNRYKTIMPLVAGVPGFEGIRIHPGNLPEHSEGCILVGEERAHGSVIRSKAAFRRLYEILAKQSERGNIQIRIVNKGDQQ